MELTWLGHSGFRLKGKEATLVTDPPSPATGYSLGRLSADVVTISHNHAGHNYAAGVGDDPKVIDGPGEYEVHGVLISGIQTYHDQERGKRLGRNTAYLITIDDIHVCHLGDLGGPLDEHAQEALSGADVLLIPVGGGNALNAAGAAQVIAQLDARIVVPMHYATAAYKPAESPPLDPLEKFLREMSAEGIEPQPKLSVTPASLPAEPQIVVLTNRG